MEEDVEKIVRTMAIPELDDVDWTKRERVQRIVAQRSLEPLCAESSPCP